jgi:hypothetical protein
MLLCFPQMERRMSRIDLTAIKVRAGTTEIWEHPAYRLILDEHHEG